jgi:hypothetical protein
MEVWIDDELKMGRKGCPIVVLTTTSNMALPGTEICPTRWKAGYCALKFEGKAYLLHLNSFHLSVIVTVAGHNVRTDI